jgi:predicted permease
MLLRRLLSLFRQHRLERELRDEIANHLAMQEEEFRRAGMTPEAARSAALREFGGVAQAAEEYREQRGLSWIEVLLHETRYALRALARNPGFTAAAILSLALGIGANTAIFSLFQALMLRMLPVAQARELVYLFQTGAGDAGYVSPSLYLELTRRTDLFTGVLARRSSRIRPEASTTINAEQVTTNFFDVLGVQPALGIYFANGQTGVAVISYRYWQTRYNADPTILGRDLALESGKLRIVGVAGPGFRGIEVENPADLWTPLTIRPSTGARYLWIMGRLKSGVSPAAAQSALDTFMTNFQRQAFAGMPESELKRRTLEQRIEVRDGAIGLSFLRDRFGKPLTVLFALVLLVLLATCANIAHLLLARGAARTRELAVRSSLGASPARLAGQTLMESLLVAVFGCAAGIGLAVWGGRYLLLFLPTSSGTVDLTPDTGVLVFAVAASLACAFLFGIAPALRSSSVDPAAALRSGPGHGRPTMRRFLVSAQVALSTLLVAVAGMFVQSFAQLRSIDLGFSDRVVTFWLDTPRKWKAADENAARTRLVADLSQLPGIAAVSYSAPDLLQGNSWRVVVRVPGHARSEREMVNVATSAAGPDFIHAIGGTITAGRDIRAGDNTTAPRIALVNQAFVREFLGGDPQALGRIFAIKPDDAYLPVTIAGIVRDATQSGLRNRPVPTMYVPAAQLEAPMSPSIVVRGNRDPAALMSAIRSEVARFGSGVALIEPRTVRQRLDDSIFQDRMLAALSGFFGALALLLAGVGLYGVIAYGMARRRSEIGIRIALGARRAQVVWMVLRGSLALVALGLAIGLPAALLAGRTVRSLLFGIEPGDPTSLLLTAAILTAIGLLAAYLPARRAASVDPTQVLRAE